MPEESKLTEKLEEKKSEVKWTEEELKQVQNIQSSYNDTTSQFGQLSIARLRVRQQAESIDKEYNSLVDVNGKPIKSEHLND